MAGECFFFDFVVVAVAVVVAKAALLDVVDVVVIVFVIVVVVVAEVFKGLDLRPQANFGLSMLLIALEKLPQIFFILAKFKIDVEMFIDPRHRIVLSLEDRKKIRLMMNSPFRWTHVIVRIFLYNCN